ncbi:PilZ domain-containing protein [Pseudomonas sp. RP23018S]|uniref:PilZ domain-containing protein n=1 Tax=Pseudomonas sp. RP23018S TaxID=3096037 RepID=UPI002ACA25A0|nr:PilZ domain-containing protein [Pseudomonas sp. RP23018S]MDZ5602363.1 PilZ domain-containing protein [Pseudomonas sp. RP23018S]
MTTPDEEERREYYRIEDSIALQISPLSAGDLADADLVQSASPLVSLLSELHLADFESQHLLRQLSDKDRILAALLRAQNKRVDLLSALVAHSLLGQLGEPQTVMLSEGGLDSTSAEPLAPGTRVAVQMVLLPRGHALLLRGRITHCQAQADGRYALGTEFTDLTDAERQLLARHILQRQQQQRRQALEQNDPTP